MRPPKIGLLRYNDLVKRVRLTLIVTAVLLARPAAPQEIARELRTAAAHLTVSATPLPSHDVLLASLPFRPEDAAGAIPVRPEDLAGALPPPPTKVTLENSFGTVTVDHAAHLARRTPCKACHGAGPVHKIGRFQPKEAHDACRKCHVELARGPTDCKGCHVKKVEPVKALAVAEPPLDPRAQKAMAVASASTLAATALPGGGAAFDPAAAALAFEEAAAWPGPRLGSPGITEASTRQLETAYYSPRRAVFAGISMLAATGSPTGAAIALKVSFRQDGWEFAESLEWSGNSGARRAIGLLGGGIVRPVYRRWTAHVLGVGGFDASDVTWTTFLPAIGARAGLEWTGPQFVIHTFDVSVTALADLMRGHDPSGAPIGGGVVSLTVSAGLDLPGRH